MALPCPKIFITLNQIGVTNRKSRKIHAKIINLNPNWHGDDFISLYFCDQIWSAENFQTFLEVKIDINWVNLAPSQAY